MKHGDIYLVDFNPSVGHEFQKERPAIVIQSDETLKSSNLITVMPLTSNLKNKRADDLLIKKSKKNSLFSDSIVKVEAIHAFDHFRFIRKIGEAESEIMDEIGNYLKKHFSI